MPRILTVTLLATVISCAVAFVSPGYLVRVIGFGCVVATHLTLTLALGVQAKRTRRPVLWWLVAAGAAATASHATWLVAAWEEYQAMSSLPIINIAGLPAFLLTPVLLIGTVLAYVRGHTERGWRYLALAVTCGAVTVALVYLNSIWGQPVVYSDASPSANSESYFFAAESLSTIGSVMAFFVAAGLGFYEFFRKEGRDRATAGATWVCALCLALGSALGPWSSIPAGAAACAALAAFFLKRRALTSQAQGEVRGV